MTGLDAVIADVRDKLTEWGYDLDVKNGREYSAQELQEITPGGRPKMRVIYTANGLDGNVKDRFDTGSPSPGVKIGHEERQVLTRRQGVEIRIWGFALAPDGLLDSTATTATHQGATDLIVNAVIAATCAKIGQAKETWAMGDGAYETKPRDVTFGALYVATFWLAIPIIFPALRRVAPSPAVVKGALIPLPGAGG